MSKCFSLQTVLCCAALLTSVLGPGLATAQGEWSRQLGGCRAFDGSPGKYTHYKNISLESCMRRCVRADCVAIEYNTEVRGCEVHFAKITATSFSKSGKTYCAIRN